MGVAMESARAHEGHQDASCVAARRTRHCKFMANRLQTTALLLAAATLALAAPAWAAGNTPPDVRVDPHRGMTFESIPKTSIEGSIYKPFRDSMKWRLMEPEHDPYRSMLQSDVYDPATGKISGGLSDKVREMRSKNR